MSEGRCAFHSEHEAALKEVASVVKELSDTMIRGEMKIKVIEKDVEETKAQNTTIQELVTSLHGLTIEIGHMVTAITNHEERLGVIESKPNKFMDAVLYMIVGGAVTTFFSMLPAILKTMSGGQ